MKLVCLLAYFLAYLIAGECKIHQLKSANEKGLKKRPLHQKKSLGIHNFEPIVVAAEASVPSSSVVVPPSSNNSVKVLQLAFYGSLGCIMPYLPMYYKSLGISPGYIGFFGAITPAINFLVSPLWGMLADTTNSHKQIMLLTFIGSVIVRCACAYKPKNLIWLSFLVALSAILSAPVKPLMDSAVMSLLTDKADYGKFRVFGQMGFGIGAYVGGLFLGKEMQKMFIVHALLSTVTACIMLNFTPKPTLLKEGRKGFFFTEKVKEKLDIKTCLKLVGSDHQILIFFFVVFLIGVSSGVVENFAYVRLLEIGTTSDQIGICRLVSSISGAPMFWLSGNLTKAIGVDGVMTMSLLSYCLRFFINFFIRLRSI